MNRPTLLFLLFSAVFTLNGCGAAQTEPSQPSTEASTTEAAATEQETETTTEAPTEATTRLPMDYVHGEDGYFNLLEEYPEIELKAQIGGTCWLFSAANSMEIHQLGSTITA